MRLPAGSGRHVDGSPAGELCSTRLGAVADGRQRIVVRTCHNRLAALAGAAVWVAAASVAPAGPAVDYTVTIDPARAPLVDVELALRGFDGAPVYLSIPLGYAFQNPESDHVEGLVATDAAGRTVEPEVIEGRIYGWDKAPMLVRYSVRLDHRSQSSRQNGDTGFVSDEYEHPYLRGNRGLLMGSAVFMVPDRWELPATVRFKLPKDWGVIAPWPKDGAAYVPPTLRSLILNYVGVGDWETESIEAAGCSVTAAFARGIALDRKPFLAQARRVMEEESRIFGRPPVSRCVLFFVDPSPGQRLAGTAKENTISIALGAESAQSAERDVLRLLAHEYFHLFGRGRQPLDDDLRFFGEGFTDYYAYVACARAQVFPTQMVLRTLERLLSELHELPSGLTLAQAQGNFFEDRNACRMCYRGGLARAIALDGALREASGGTRSLEGLVAWLYSEGIPPRTPVPRPFTYSDWLRAAAEWWPQAPDGLFDAGLAEPLPWDLAALLAPAGLNVRSAASGLALALSDDSWFALVLANRQPERALRELFALDWRP